MTKGFWNESTVEPRYFEVPREMKKKFEMAGFQNNQRSVKIRNSESYFNKLQYITEKDTD